LTWVAIIVAAGRGERMGVPAKILATLDGQPAISYSLRAAAASNVEAIVLVAGPHTEDRLRQIVAELDANIPVDIVLGGERRQDSVLAGLRTAHALGATFVAVHDGARPLVSPVLFDQTLDAAAIHGAAIAATPIVDTIKLVQDGMIEQTIPRDGLWAAQTPQAFAVRALFDAFEQAELRGLTVTDEAALFEALDWPVAIVPGDRANIKLTHAEDLELLDALVRSRREAGAQ
jgi:2-C-methyl-D-erythritol 4-phosphate cytidylyltransferase